MFLILVVIGTTLFLVFHPHSPPTSPPPTSPPPTSPPPTSPQPTSPRKNTIYKGQDFLALFDVYPVSSDPTHGVVDYHKYPTIENNDLIKYDNKFVYLGCAGASQPYTATTVTIEDKNNIPSIRIYTKNRVYNGGLFSIEIFHIPSGQGVWPAIWFSQDPHQTLPDGTNGQWPLHGEIDWIENVNSAKFNISTLHIDGWVQDGLCPLSCEFQDPNYCDGKGCVCPNTCDAKKKCGIDCPYICSPKIKNMFTTQYVTPDSHCTVHGGNVGCGVNAPDNSFGDDFNDNYSSDGAVFSMNWEPMDLDGNNFTITFWFITDREIIDSLDYGPFSDNPDPSRWGEPYAIFDNTNTASKCPINNAQLIINITLCGDSPEKIHDCNQNILTQLKEAYFQIGRFAEKVT